MDYFGSKKFVVCAREGGANTTPFSSPVFWAAHFAKQKTKSGSGESQPSPRFRWVDEGGAGIPFPPTPFPPRSARARGLWVFRNFSVQKWFELRLEFPTNQNLTIFQDEKIARSRRLRRVSLRKKPVVWRLNQTAGEARRGLFLQAGGGLELRSNSQMKFVSNFFLSAEGGIRSQFLIPRFTAKGD